MAVVASPPVHGEDVNRYVNGHTLLHTAAMRGNAELVTELIAQGADVNARVQSYDPPREISSFGIETLSDSVFFMDRLGMTPLHLAAVEGHTDVAEILLAQGADIHAKDNQGRTPLSVTRLGKPYREGHTGMAKLLRRHGALE